MSRYIDAEETKSVINANDWSNPVVPQVVGYIIDRMPTADVVEVVRCKDCVHSGECELPDIPKEVLWCNKLVSLAHEKHYCSYGERREDTE